MGDAEIIPIGTRGRPGRGSGKSSSSAARGLAGPAKKSRPAQSDNSTPKAPVTAADAATTERSVASVEDPVGGPSGPTVPSETTDCPKPTPVNSTPESDLAAEPVDAGGDVAPATTRERNLLASISSGEWLSAFQRAAKEVFGEQWEPQLARFLAFLRRRITGEFVIDEYGFDAEVTQQFFLAAVRPLAESWFRVEVIGAENIPSEGGALVVSNHSGTVPIDGLMTAVSIYDHTGRHLRPLGADLVFRLPVVSGMARKGGATLACNADAERMLSGGELVGVWPEGFKGIGKPFSDRYKLQRFGRGGFVSAALRTGVPIIPLSVVGAEEIYPLVGNIPSLARILGVPYIPITPLFPLLGPLGLVPLPSKWLMEFGEPIRTDEYDESAIDDPMLVFDVTDQVRETIQQTLYSLLKKRESVFR